MRNIFLLEDDFYLRRDLKLLLTEAGYETAAAGSLAEASALLFRDPAFDLYLLDLWLPDGDGMTLLTQIRRRSDAPVLFLTVCDDEPSVIRALEQGADDYITNPFRKAELLSRIRRLEIRYGEQLIPVTMTFGVSEWDPGMSLDDLIRSADRKLYYGKESGRNRVVVHLDPEQEESIPEEEPEHGSRLEARAQS